MSRRMHLIIQDRITRGIDPTEAAQAVGAKLTMISTDPLASLLEIDRTIDLETDKPVLFCSLQMASQALHRCANLKTGVVLPKDFLHHGAYTSLLDPDIRLNPTGIYLPWGEIPRNLALIDASLPGDLFLRPNSPMKPYPGFAIAREMLLDEHRIRTQSDRVDPSEMTYIAPKLDLPSLEYRTWIIDAQVVAQSPYSWTEADMVAAGDHVPQAVTAAAKRVARRLEQREQIYTADFVLIDGQAKLVELNALTTSGWYPAIDLENIFRACDDIFV